MKLSVAISVYKLEQDNTTKELRFYNCSVCTKVIPAEKLYTMDELFDLLCELCHDNVEEE